MRDAAYARRSNWRALCAAWKRPTTPKSQSMFSAADELLDPGERALAFLQDVERALRAVALGQDVEAGLDAGGDLAAVARAAAPAGVLGVEHQRAASAARGLQRRVQARVARADDRDVDPRRERRRLEAGPRDAVPPVGRELAVGSEQGAHRGVESAIVARGGGRAVIVHPRGSGRRPFSATIIVGRVGVAGGQRGEHRRVDHAQPVDAVDAQPGVDDGVARVRPHPAGADRMEHGRSAARGCRRACRRATARRAPDAAPRRSPRATRGSPRAGAGGARRRACPRRRAPSPASWARSAEARRGSADRTRTIAAAGRPARLRAQQESGKRVGTHQRPLARAARACSSAARSRAADWAAASPAACARSRRPG